MEKLKAATLQWSVKAVVLLFAPFPHAVQLWGTVVSVVLVFFLLLVCISFIGGLFVFFFQHKHSADDSLFWELAKQKHL